jgi:mannose-6-phosphate isomerase-like protein (cupin superfamily)
MQEQFKISELAAVREQIGQRYHEFLRVPSMSVGIYALAAGEPDPQQPHAEDELYYIAQGRATLSKADEEIPVEAGSLVFVAANVEHRFHSVTEDLLVIVFFAPAEYSQVNS